MPDRSGSRAGAGRGPGEGRRVPAGRTRAAAVAGRAAGRPFPRCAPGGAGFACSWPPPRASTAARAGGETRSPVRRRVVERVPRARRKAAPGELAGAGRARRGPGEAGTPVPRPHSLPTPIKVEWQGRAGAALAAAASLRPRS